MAARCVAVIEIFLDGLGIGIGLFFLSYLTYSSPCLSQELRSTLLGMGFLGLATIPPQLEISAVIIYLIYVTTLLFFAVLLHAGQKSATICRLWMFIGTINLIAKGVQFVYYLFWDKRNLSMGVVIFFLEVLIRLAMICVVVSHIGKVKLAKSIQRRPCGQFNAVNHHPGSHLNTKPPNK